VTATAPGHTAQHADQTDVTILASYIADRWTTPDPTAPGATVTDITDASTGEVTAQTISGSPAATGFTTTTSSTTPAPSATAPSPR
jgi:hypothetical protein